MHTDFLYAQAPNRTGNVSKQPPSKSGGSTNVTGPKHGVSTPGGQGAPKAGGNVYPVGNKMSLSKPTGYCGTIMNDGYLKGSGYSK